MQLSFRIGQLHFTADPAAVCNHFFVFCLIGQTGFFGQILEVEYLFANELTAFNPKKCFISPVATEETGMFALVENGIGNGIEQGLQESKLPDEFGLDLTPIRHVQHRDEQ